MIQEILEMVKEGFIVKELEVEKYSTIDKSGMHIQIHSYTVEGVGCISTVQTKAMLGMMNMESVIITPLRVDAPLFSFDLIHAMGTDTLLLELYDTRIHDFGDFTKLNGVKDKAFDLPTYKTESRWYDSMKMPASFAKKGKKLGERFEALVKDFVTNYLRFLAEAPFCNPVEKREKVSDYVEGLLSNGGPAVDQFIKMLGKEETASLFRRYIFFSRPDE